MAALATRRAMLGAAAIPLIAVPAIAAPAHSVAADREAERHSLVSAYVRSDLSEEEDGARYARILALERQVAAASCSTRADAKAKLEMLYRSYRETGDGSCYAEHVLTQVIAFLETH